MRITLQRLIAALSVVCRQHTRALVDVNMRHTTRK